MARNHLSLQELGTARKKMETSIKQSQKQNSANNHKGLEEDSSLR